MDTKFYQNLIEKSLADTFIGNEACNDILNSKSIELLSLLNAAFTIRKRFCGLSVKIHILNNVQNGLCNEDCQYCAQSKNSQAEIEIYSMKSDEEILQEARSAYENGAFRYCMVFSGKGISDSRIKHIAKLVVEIKNKYNIEVCVSAGIVNTSQAKILKNAGLNRLNHNINTSKEIYNKICTTHTYEDRLKTLNAAKEANLQICSGVIIGMGETSNDIVTMAKTLHDLKIESIPVNFFMPIEGLPLSKTIDITPEYCLRVLCLFRFLNPKSEIRVAAGRELYLRDMETMAFYPANSLFMNGYLNTKGKSSLKTLQMLKDGGFTIESDKELDDLIMSENNSIKKDANDKLSDKLILKNKYDLRPKKN